jgi:hypothetical protein
MLFFIRFDARFSRCPSAPIFSRVWHLGDLPPPGDQIGQRRGIGVGQGPDRRPGRHGEPGDHPLGHWGASIGSVFARLPSEWAKAEPAPD